MFDNEGDDSDSPKPLGNSESPGEEPPRAITGPSCYDIAAKTKIISVVKHAPSDLSTNPVHFEGFGET